MAEIKIEKKTKKPIWPWIVGILLLVGAIWVIGEVADSPENELAEAEMHVAPEARPGDDISDLSQMETPAASTAAIDDFLAYVEDDNLDDQLGTDHQTTSEAFLKLSAALREISNGQFEQEISQIEQNAQQFQGNPEFLTDAVVVSSAFTNAANAMQQIQSNQFPNAEKDVQEVMEKAREINEDRQMTNQRDNIEDFFDEAADALETMKRGIQG